jgi:hypothetical protein
MREMAVTITWDVTRVNKYGMPVEFACPRDGIGSDGSPSPQPPLATLLDVRYAGRVGAGPGRALRFVERLVPGRGAREEIRGHDRTDSARSRRPDDALRACTGLLDGVHDGGRGASELDTIPREAGSWPQD